MKRIALLALPLLALSLISFVLPARAGGGPFPQAPGYSAPPEVYLAPAEGAAIRELRVTWDRYPFPRSIRSAYRLTVRQFDLATETYVVTAEAYHIMFKPLNTQFNWVNLQNLVRYDVQSYIVVEPYTYVIEKAENGSNRYVYTAVPNAEAMWSAPFAFRTTNIFSIDYLP